MVGNTFGVGGKFQVLGAHGRRADSLLHAGDVALFHPLGVVVNLLFHHIGFFQCVQAFVAVCLDGIVVQLVKQGLELTDFIFGIIGKLLVGIGQDGGVLHDILCIVSDSLQVTDVPVGARKVGAVFLAQPASSAQAHDKADELAVDEVKLLFLASKQAFPGKIQARGHFDGAVHVIQGNRGHAQDFALDLRNGNRRCPEHVFIYKLQGEFGLRGGGTLRNHALHQGHQHAGEGQHDGHRHRIEEGVEHGQLHLRGRGEYPLKEAAVGKIEPAQTPGSQQEDEHAGTVEQQVDKSRAFGIGSAGDTGNDSHYAGADVGTHGKVDALVYADKPRHHHGQRNGSHDGGTLDDGGEDGSQQHQQQGIPDTGEEGLDTV